MSRAFGLTGRSKIFRRDATGLGEAGTMQPFGLLFADPPYGKGLGERALQSAQRRRLALARCAVRGRGGGGGAIRAGPGFSVVDERGYGETVIRIIEHEPKA